MAIYEICQQGAMSNLVLEYVLGGSLDDRLTEQRVLAECSVQGWKKRGRS
jgi:hypothetical protein